MADRQSLSLRTDALDVIVELLGEVDAGSGFYDRLCAALCRLASMERAILMLYDDVRQLVVPVGSHGIEPGLLAEVYGTLEETPIAQVAFAEDRVVEVSGELERWLPARYARFGGIDTLTCTPVSAGGRWLGVILADRGGGPFQLTDDERHAMWTLGKTAALAASVRIATSQQGRARLLQSRIDLAREVHESVIQRLFGALSDKRTLRLKSSQTVGDGVSSSASCARYMSTLCVRSLARLPSSSRKMRSRESPRSDGSPLTDQKTFVLNTTWAPRSLRQSPIQLSLLPPP